MVDEPKPPTGLEDLPEEVLKTLLEAVKVGQKKGQWTPEEKDLVAKAKQTCQDILSGKIKSETDTA